MAEFKGKVKEEMKPDLDHVDANRLTVWRCEKRTKFVDGDLSKLQEQVREVMKSSTTKIFGSRKPITEVSQAETLLVSMPSMCSSFSTRNKSESEAELEPAPGTGM